MDQQTQLDQIDQKSTLSDVTEWNPENYHNNSQFQEHYAHEVLKTIEFRGTEHVLDVGCGDGKITAYIAKELVPQGSVFGVDQSKQMISFAQNKYQGKKEYARLEFMVSDVRNLPFDHEFDTVVSFWCLHWVQEQELALMSIEKALKTSGIFAAALPLMSEQYLEIRREIRKTSLRDHWKNQGIKTLEQWSWPHTVLEYQKKLSNVGLVPLKVEEFPAKYRYKDRESFIKARAATIPEVRLIDSKKAYLFAQEAFEGILNKQHYYPDGSFDYSVSFLVVKARKG